MKKNLHLKRFNLYWQVPFTASLLLIFSGSCTKNNPAKNAHYNSLDTLRDAPGIVMNADTVKPVTTIKTAGIPQRVKAGAPEVKALNLSYGEAGGYTFMQNYTTDNGLALDAISLGRKNTLCDRAGNLWFGTYGGGVSRYDGKFFTNFTIAQGLPNNIVDCITEDRKGNFWFATRDGVSCYNGKKFTTYTTAQGLVDNNAYCITEDRKGRIWFGTYGGVSCYDGKVFTNFTRADGLLTNVVYCITEDRLGRLWFGTNNGIACYDGHTFTNYAVERWPRANSVYSITEDRGGNLWFGLYGGGIICYNGKSFTGYTTVQGLPSNLVYNILEDDGGNLWIGTNGGGVSRYDGKTFTNFTKAQGLVNNKVLGITKDKTGNLWFATYGGGLSRYDGQAFTNYTTIQGLGSNAVLSIEEDKSGKIWFGTNEGGVSCYDGKAFVNYTKEQGLPSDYVLSILEDRAGRLWLGTFNGVCCYDGKSFTNYTIKQGLLDNSVYSIIEDRLGRFWFGTSDGVSCYDGKTFTNYANILGLTNNFVHSILEDSSGKLWFSTDGGITCYDGKSFANYTMAQGLVNNTVYSITEDKAGNLWCSTFGGLSRYDGSSFLNITTAQGLPDNSVMHTAITQDQYVIAGTNAGLGIIVGFRLKEGAGNPETNIAAINHLSNEALAAYEPLMEVYNAASGYPVKDINAGQGTIYCDSKGIIWLSTGADKTGLVRLDYEALHKNPHSPKVLIESLTINDETICWYNLSKPRCDSITKSQQETMTFGRPLSSKEHDSITRRFAGIQFDGIDRFYPLPQNLVLPYKNNHIGFEFTAIEPARPHLVRYRYFLEGYDNEWSPPTTKTDVSYGNIYEGSYTFKLKACSPSGVWSEPVSYTFTVLPPWWRTGWMYVLYGVLLVALVVAIVWLNGRRLLERAKELKQKVNEATAVIRKQKQLTEEKHKEITDSINYAQRIQRALLASKQLLDGNFKEYFILFKPKDIVSGDFYWAKKMSNNQFVMLTADSTGHGVPGAIMSILNISCIEKAIEVEKLISPEKILDHTRIKIIETLQKDGSSEGGKDGMDGSLLSFDFENYMLHLATSNNPVWIVRDGDLLEIKADRFPIGRHEKQTVPFTLHCMALQKGDVVYSLTDGFADQFGGPAGKKFKYKQLQNLILSISQEPMADQQHTLSTVFDDWKGDLEQVDDVCLIGVRI